MKFYCGFHRTRGCVAIGLTSLLILALIHPVLTSASEREILRRAGQRQAPPQKGKPRKVTPLPPERGTPNLHLPNLDEVRQRRSQDARTPAPVQSTTRSRRKSGRPAPEKRAHHRNSRRVLTANSKNRSISQPGVPQSGGSPFTNDPLKNPNDPDSFIVKAIHITELRSAINLVRHRRHLPNYQWATPAPGGVINHSVLISWTPIHEMQEALDQAIGAPPHGYTPGDSLQPVLAIHITELRERVKDALGLSSVADQLIPRRVDPFNQSSDQIQARDAEWSLPLVSLPGRAGMDLNIDLSYSSLVWTQAGSSISFDDDWGDPSPGFKLGFPTIQGPFTNNLAGANVYILITSAGRRVELRRAGSTSIYEAVDSSYVQLIESSGSLQLRTTDGTQMTYNRFDSGWHCMSIEDRNGNMIVANYNSFGDITDISDTLGRTFNFNYDGNYNLQSISQTWTVNGAAVTHNWATFGWGTVTMHPAFSGVNVVGVSDGESIPVLKQVGLPDGSHYNFAYNGYGQVNKISLYAADGGPGTADDLYRAYFAYDYEVLPADCPRMMAARVWARNWNDPVHDVPSEVVTSFADNHDGSHQMTAPDGTVYKEVYGGPGDAPAWQHGLVTSTQVITGSTPQKSTTTSYAQDNESVNYQTNPRIIEINIYDGPIDPGHDHRRTKMAYTSFGLPSDIYEFDSKGTTVLRRRHTEYNPASMSANGSYTSRRIIGLPSATFVCDGAQGETPCTNASGTSVVAKTSYEYDTGIINPQATTAVGHDQSYDSSLTVRGNLTSVSRWDVNSLNTTFTTTTMAYNAAGSLMSTSDPLGHTNSISYADKFSADGTYLDPALAFSTFAYPTMMTDADGFSSSVWYEYDFSARTRTQGPPPGYSGQYTSGIIQRLSYDAAPRLKQVTTVNNQGAYVHYDYGPDYVSTFASVNSVAANYWESDSYTNQFVDGLGRVFAVASNHPGSFGGNKAQYIRYDKMGRAVQQTNPFEIDSGWNPTGDDSAYQFNVANTFDWKGRPLRTYNMDGTFKEASYAGCGCAGGEVVTLTDERQRQQRVYSDVLGRQWKTEVLDDNDNVYSSTATVYNARDQVTAVNSYKGAVASSLLCPDGTCMQATTTYDGYGRVATHRLPQQTAASSFEYKDDDSVWKVTDPRGVIATNSYNGRHLLTGVSYDPQSSGVPWLTAVTFGYDAAGNRTSVTDGTGSTTLGYDQLSRVTSESHYLNDLGASYAMSYGYNLAGELASVTDPSNAQVSYEYDSAGRLTGMPTSSYAGLTSFLSNAQYRAFGALKQATYGNSVQLNLTYNTRIQIGQYQLSSSSFTAGATMTYYDDGRTNTAFDLSDSRFDRKYEFDFAARLKEAYSGAEAHGASAPPLAQANSPYRQSYSYDEWNNATLRMGRIWSTQSDYDLASYGSENKRAGFGYDVAGNITSDTSGVRSYDAAGRPATFGSAQNWQIYPNWSPSHPDGPALETTDAFDGSGQVVKHTERVRQDLSTQASDGYIAYYMTDTSTTTYYVHSVVLGGKTIAELNRSGVKTKGYVYSGGARVATQNVWSDGSSVTIESTNPVTGAVTTTDVNGTSAGRAEPDPLGRELSAPPDPQLGLDPVGISSKLDHPMYIEYMGGPSQDAIDGLAAWGLLMRAGFDQRQADYFWHHGRKDIAVQILEQNPNVGVVDGKKTYWGSNAADFLKAQSQRPKPTRPIMQSVPLPKGAVSVTIIPVEVVGYPDISLDDFFEDAPEQNPDWDPSCDFCARGGLRAIANNVAPIPIATAIFAGTSVVLGTGGGFALSHFGVLAGTTTLSIESATVTDTAVIGGLNSTGQFVAQQGYNVLQHSASYSWSEVNIPWLENIVRSGQFVRIAAGASGAATAREIEYLRSAGYVQIGNMLFPGIK